MITWCIAVDLTQNDPTRFGLFMEYCSGFVSEENKVRLFAAIAKRVASEDARVYDELQRDLENIRQVRNRVGHSTAVRKSTGEVVYVKRSRSGRMEEVAPDALETAVTEALRVQPKINGALSAVMTATGFNFLENGWG